MKFTEITLLKLKNITKIIIIKTIKLKPNVLFISAFLNFEVFASPFG
jgi:hypothetical protein